MDDVTKRQTPSSVFLGGARHLATGWKFGLLALTLSLTVAGCSDPTTGTPTLSPPPAYTPTATPVTVTPTNTMTPSLPPSPSDLDLDDDGFTDLEGDCNDDDNTVYPGATETPYDGVDQDCAGGDLTDVDGDTYDGGTGPDCDDTSSNTYPGATEIGDGKDNDCDGTIDDGVDTVDNDGDGASELEGDCNDDDDGIYPGATEVPYDGIDQDCSGTDLTDVDEDGSAGGPDGADCNDTDATVHPGASEVPYDTIDQDCNGDDLTDVDEDGTDGGPNGDDCDDNDPTRAPGNTEIPYDGVDQDCSGADLTDQDLDGYPGGSEGTDCNDTNDQIFPGAQEVPYDTIDQDCSGSDLVDVDGDTYAGGAEGPDCDDQDLNTYPGAPEFADGKDNDCDGKIDEELNTTDDDGDGTSEANGDCNDADTSIYPGATEIPYDGIDQDCSGSDLSDIDQDGFDGGTNGSDCNDQNDDIYPGATEIPYDTIDQDCNNGDLTDVDGDTYIGTAAGGDDCNDQEALVNPGASEVPYDTIDQDCSGADLTDVDGDGVDSTLAGGTDCNDTNAAIKPSASEVCDGVDNNCDGVVDADAVDRLSLYQDSDLDGYGNPAANVLTCQKTPSLVADNTDCNDASNISYPGATEVCDTLDNNCDTVVDEGVTTAYFADEDVDGYGDPNTEVQACSAPEGTVEDDSDCDDEVSSTYPGAPESCNGVDDDCDDAIDEGVLTTYYQDSDNDTYGKSNVTAEACAKPTGYATRGQDCNDQASNINPGATEVCDANNVDENCNTLADDADSTVDPSTKSTFYRDTDGDGYGSPTVTTKACDLPTGYVTNNLDCNAADATINPGATEIAGDNVDQNCDSAEICFKDADNDGYRPDTTSTVTSSDTDCLDANEAVTSDPTTDCNDANAAIKPGATELAGDSVDQNCDGLETCYKDADNDGYRPDTTSTVASSDTDCLDANEAVSSDPTTDCNDSNAAIKPGATEIAGDNIDQNCDATETCFKDADDDGYRPDTTSTVASSDADCLDASEAVTTDPTTDCNDANAAIKPGATEIAGDNVDQNCDATETCFKDADNDGYRPDTTSTVASSDADCLDANEAVSSDPAGDCNDGNPAIKPGATEIAGDSIDQNCDGGESCFKDADDDGYRPDTTSTVASSDTDCTDASEAVSTDPTGDCNDTNAAIKPGTTELAGDSVDQNCDGLETCYKDADNDGYRPDSTSTVSSSDTDCNDAAEAISSDPTGDCNDTNAAINPAATETADGVDQDCDGTADDGVNQISCNALKTNVPSSPSGVYTIDPDGTGAIAPFQVYCDMTSDGGGWTLVLKANGNATTFTYDSTYWTSNNTLNTGDPGFNTNEAKLNSYNTVPLTQVRVVMRDGSDRSLVFSKSGSSLLSLISGGSFSATSLGRNTWKGLMANPSLQPNCNSEGLNVICGGDTKIRIGITSNQENDCGSCDSRIGVGGFGSYCGQDTNNTVGNTATCSPDNGDRNTKGFGFVFVR